MSGAPLSWRGIIDAALKWTSREGAAATLRGAFDHADEIDLNTNLTEKQFVIGVYILIVLAGFYVGCAMLGVISVAKHAVSVIVLTAVSVVLLLIGVVVLNYIL